MIAFLIAPLLVVPQVQDIEPALELVHEILDHDDNDSVGEFDVEVKLVSKEWLVNSWNRRLVQTYALEGNRSSVFMLDNHGDKVPGGVARIDLGDINVDYDFTITVRAWEIDTAGRRISKKSLGKQTIRLNLKTDSPKTIRLSSGDNLLRITARAAGITTKLSLDPRFSAVLERIPDHSVRTVLLGDDPFLAPFVAAPRSTIAIADNEVPANLESSFQAVGSNGYTYAPSRWSEATALPRNLAEAVRRSRTVRMEVAEPGTGRIVFDRDVSSEHLGLIDSALRRKRKRSVLFTCLKTPEDGTWILDGTGTYLEPFQRIELEGDEELVQALLEAGVELVVNGRPHDRPALQLDLSGIRTLTPRVGNYPAWCVGELGARLRARGTNLDQLLEAKHKVADGTYRIHVQASATPVDVNIGGKVSQLGREAFFVRLSGETLRATAALAQTFLLMALREEGCPGWPEYRLANAVVPHLSQTSVIVEFQGEKSIPLTASIKMPDGSRRPAQNWSASTGRRSFSNAKVLPLDLLVDALESGQTEFRLTPPASEKGVDYAVLHLTRELLVDLDHRFRAEGANEVLFRAHVEELVFTLEDLARWCPQLRIHLDPTELVGSTLDGTRIVELSSGLAGGAPSIRPAAAALDGQSATGVTVPWRAIRSIEPIGFKSIGAFVPRSNYPDNWVKSLSRRPGIDVVSSAPLSSPPILEFGGHRFVLLESHASEAIWSLDVDDRLAQTLGQGRSGFLKVGSLTLEIPELGESELLILDDATLTRLLKGSGGSAPHPVRPEQAIHVVFVMAETSSKETLATLRRHHFEFVQNVVELRARSGYESISIETYLLAFVDGAPKLERLVGFELEKDEATALRTERVAVSMENAFNAIEPLINQVDPRKLTGQLRTAAHLLHENKMLAPGKENILLILGDSRAGVAEAPSDHPEEGFGQALHLAGFMSRPDRASEDAARVRLLEKGVSLIDS